MTTSSAVAADSAVGVEAIDVYLPTFRIERAELASIWGATGRPGRRSVANFDEDVITMGVRAGQRALAGSGRRQVDAVLFVTTSPVTIEGQHAAVVAAALGLDPPICVDVTSSLRGGLDAIGLATLLVRGGSAESVLVVAADQRVLPPGSPSELLSGDAAAAVVVGRGSVMLQLGSCRTVSAAGPSLWRRIADPATVSGDERFVARELVTPWLANALAVVCPEQDRAETRAVLTSPLPRVARAVARTARLTVPESRVVDDEIGFAGVAAPLIELIARSGALHDGQRVVLGAAGDGATAVMTTVVDAARLRSVHATLLAHLAARRTLSAGLYLRLRGQLPQAPVDPFTSEVLLHREQAATFDLLGSRCGKCGVLEFPRRRVCQRCGAVDLFELEPLPRQGVLYTLTTEYLFPVPTNQLVMAVVDLGETRFYTQLADADPEACSPGTPVRLVLRRIHDGGGIPHYFWKAQVDGGDDEPNP